MRPSIGALSLLGLTVTLGTAAQSMPALPSGPPERPRLVLDAIKNGEPIYYFAIGSNLSRTKLEGRAICGKKIHVISMEPAVVPDHRLAFNMTGFPPLEPGMGSLEPLDDDSHAPLLGYERQECHGALIQLTPEDYERVYLSEGGGQGRHQGYEEIIVTAVPYDGSKPAVQAVAFRAREHVRLRKDPAPSPRYMGILRDGAKELGLRECYQQWLEDHPVQVVSNPVFRSIARNNAVFTVITAFVLRLRMIPRYQSRLLYWAYVPPTQTSLVRRAVGGIFSGLFMLPGASIGLFMRTLMELLGTMDPKMRAFLFPEEAKQK